MPGEEFHAEGVDDAAASRICGKRDAFFAESLADCIDFTTPTLEGWEGATALVPGGSPRAQLTHVHVMSKTQ